MIRPLRLIIVSAVGFVLGCSRQPETVGRRAAAAPANTGVHTRVVDDAARARLRRATAGDEIGALQVIRSNTERYATSLGEQTLLNRIVTEDTEYGDLSLAEMSNLVAALPTRVIMDMIAPLQYKRSKKVARTRAIMRLYEVVLARGQPKSAELFARIELANYYGSCFWDGEEASLALLREARLSTNPSEAEKNSYATIQLRLATLLPDTNPQASLKQIERVKEMAARGVVPFGQQPLDMLEMTRARCLIYLGRIEEARRHLADVYARVKSGALDGSLRGYFEHRYFEDVEPGVEGYIEMTLRYKKSARPMTRDQFESID